MTLRQAARRSVVLPIFAGFACNLIYGIWLFKLVRIPFDCSLVVPQISEFKKVSSATDFCSANSILLTAYVYLLANITVTVLLVYAINWGIRVPGSERKELERTVRGIRYATVALGILFAIHWFFGIRLTRRFESGDLTAEMDVASYAIWQMRVFVFFVGTFATAVIIALLMPRFETVDIGKR
jgi:hypothetical protein